MDIYKRALKTWGKEPQMLQVIEEMSELIKDRNHYTYRYRSPLARFSLVEKLYTLDRRNGRARTCYGRATRF